MIFLTIRIEKNTWKTQKKIQKLKKEQIGSILFSNSDADSCFLHNGGKIHEGPEFLPRKMTIVSNQMDVLTLDAEDYLAIFHPGSVTLIKTLKNLKTTKNGLSSSFMEQLDNNQPTTTSNKIVFMTHNL